MSEFQLAAIGIAIMWAYLTYCSHETRLFEKLFEGMLDTFVALIVGATMFALFHVIMGGTINV